MNLGNINTAGSSRREPKRVAFSTVGELGDVIEAYFEGRDGGEVGGERAGCIGQLMRRNKREQDVYVGHPASGVSVVLAANALDAGPQRLVGNDAESALGRLFPSVACSCGRI